MKKFDSPTALAYDQDIRARIPGYDLIQELLCSILQVEAPMEQASVLVAGSGSGEEILRLSQQRLGWSFTGVDPSEAMNGLAAEKFQQNGISNHVKIESKKIQDFHSASKYEIGLSILVSHFIPDDGSKENYFKNLATHLQPGAPVIIVDFMQMNAQINDKCVSYHYFWAKQKAELDSAQLGSLPSRLKEMFFPVSELRLQEILHNSGLKLEGSFAQALGICGYMARKI